MRGPRFFSRIFLVITLVFIYLHVFAQASTGGAAGQTDAGLNTVTTAEEAPGTQVQPDGTAPAREPALDGSDINAAETANNGDGEPGRSEPLEKEDMLSFRSYKVAIGLVLNCAAFGLHIEYRFIPYIGLKFMLLNIYSLSFEPLDPGELIIAGLLAPTFHIPLKRNLLDPYLFFGMFYSDYHWIHDKNDNEGDIRDLTFAGGFGLGVRMTDYVDLGFNIWMNYDYKIEWTETEAEKGSRIVMVLPYFSIKLLF